MLKIVTGGLCKNAQRHYIVHISQVLSLRFPSFFSLFKFFDPFVKTTWIGKTQCRQEYHVVIGPDAKHLSEVTKGDWSVCFEPEVSVVVARCQVTAFAARKITNQGIYFPKRKPTSQKEICLHTRTISSQKYFSKLTWERRCFPRLQSLAAIHLSQVSGSSFPPCVWCPTVWPP